MRGKRETVPEGKSVRLFLVDGSPGGLLTAEIVNWTGHVLAGPRSEVSELLRREETGRTGIYILLGDDPESLGGTHAYVGEADEVRSRLRSHARPLDQGGKDFWERAIVITSKDTNLTKAHARYLESRFISLALSANRATLDNATTPPPLSLPEADVSDMENFVEQAQILLPVLGVNMFRAARHNISGSDQTSVPTGSSARGSSPVFELHIRKEGLVARAQEIDGEFTVLAGSDARIGWPAQSRLPGYRALKEKLEADGTLLPTEDRSKNKFTHDQVFASPSAAGAVVVGHAANGRTKWRIPESGLSYGEWQFAETDFPTVSRGS